MLQSVHDSNFYSWDCSYAATDWITNFLLHNPFKIHQNPPFSFVIQENKLFQAILWTNPILVAKFFYVCGFTSAALMMTNKVMIWSQIQEYVFTHLLVELQSTNICTIHMDMVV